MSSASKNVARALHRRGRHARRHVDEHPQRQLGGRPQQHPHALGAEDVADLVRVDHHAGDAARHDRSGKLARRQQRALDVQVPVDQPRQHERAGHVDLARAVVTAYADNVPVVDGDVGRHDLVGEQVDDPAALQHEIGRRPPAGHLDAVSQRH
jgi:hypothetical protein